jgi:hypothetical protein
VGSQRYSGVILDLSATGFFVQTIAKPAPQDRVTVEISVPGQREPVRVEARVARLRVVPPQLMNVAHGGIGLRITNAPEAYFGFLGALMPEPATPETATASLAPSGPAPSPAVPPEARAEAARGAGERAFRVRLSQNGGRRSRTLRCFAPSAEEAAARALAEIGEGWSMLEAREDEDAAATGSR